MAQDIKTADIAIIGTGPAGISAAITAKIRNKEILLFGAEPVSSKVAKAHRILNYPGLPAVSGEELAQAYKRHLDELQIAVTKKRVHAVYAMGSYFAIQAGDEQYRADSVILACGMTADKPFPGENEFLGRGVSYCATCDAQFFKGKTVAVIGYTKESVEEAQYLAEIVGKVLYFPMGKEAVLPELSGNIEICTEKPAEITGTMKVEQLKTDAVSGGRHFHFTGSRLSGTARSGLKDRKKSCRRQSADGNECGGIICLRRYCRNTVPVY